MHSESLRWWDGDSRQLIEWTFEGGFELLSRGRRESEPVTSSACMPVHE